MTIFCSPGKNWAACFAQKWGCSPEEIEEVFGAPKATYGAIKNAYSTMKSRGYRYVHLCEDCAKIEGPD